MLNFFKRRPCNKGLIKVVLEGGFGNQLFQFAVATQIAMKERVPLSLEFKKGSRSYALDFLGLNQGTNYKVTIDAGILKFEPLLKIDKCPLIEFREKSFTYSEIKMNAKHVELIGYFQSFKYFEEIAESLRNFILSHIAPQAGQSNAIFIHARLGDMALNPTSRAYHGIISDEYVRNALETFDMPNQKIVVITEDRKDLEKKLPWTASRADEIQCKSLEEDFRTLLSAKNLIISNSTFSWWAAWLAEAETAAPKNWFTREILQQNPIHDLIPENWRLI